MNWPILKTMSWGWLWLALPALFSEFLTDFGAGFQMDSASLRSFTAGGFRQATIVIPLLAGLSQVLVSSWGREPAADVLIAAGGSVRRRMLRRSGAVLAFWLGFQLFGAAWWGSGVGGSETAVRFIVGTAATVLAMAIGFGASTYIRSIGAAGLTVIGAWLLLAIVPLSAGSRFSPFMFAGPWSQATERPGLWWILPFAMMAVGAVLVGGTLIIPRDERDIVGRTARFGAAS